MRNRNYPAYSIEDTVKETEATLAMEGMILTEDEKRKLDSYAKGKVSGDELRRQIFSSVTDADRGVMAEVD